MVNRIAHVNPSECFVCCGCISVCPEGALTWIARRVNVDEESCIGCGKCTKVCPVGAISLVEVKHS